MEKHKKIPFQRILAAVLAIVLVIASIPFGGLMTSKVQAGDGTNGANETGSSLVIQVKDNGDENLIMDAVAVTVTATPSENDTEHTTVSLSDLHPVYSAVVADNNKIIITGEDYDKLAAIKETGGTVTVKAEGEGYVEYTEPISDLSAPVEVNMTAKETFSATLSTSLIYNGSSQNLICAVTEPINTNDITYGDVQYAVNSTDVNDYAVYDEGSHQIPQGIDAGTYDVYLKVEKTNSSNINSPVVTEVKRHYKVVIAPKDRETFQFQNTSVSDIPWNATVTNVAALTESSTEDVGAVTYSVDDDNNDTTVCLATVDENGTVSFQSDAAIGKTYTVTATMQAAGNYSESAISYTVRVTVADSRNPVFQQETPDEMTYDAENTTFTNKMVKKVTDGTEEEIPNVTYTIKEVKDTDNNIVDSTKKNNYFTVNESSGEVTIHKAGSVTVQAELSDAAAYDEKKNTYTYTLRVKKAIQSLKFIVNEQESADNKSTITYGNNLQIAYEKVGEGNISLAYSAVDETNNSVENYTSVASVSDDNGILTVTPEGIGTLTIQATVAETDNYEEVTKNYVITIEKAKEFVAFGTSQIDSGNVKKADAFYGVNDTFDMDIQASDMNRITYEIDKNGFAADVLAVQTQEGKMHITGLPEADQYDQGYLEITAKVDGRDSNYNAASDTVRIYLKTETSSAMYQTTATQGSPVSEGGIDKWYLEDVKLTAPEGYKMSTSNTRDAEFYDTINITETKSGNIYYMRTTDTTGNIITGPSYNFYIDKNAPKDLEIQYTGFTYDNLTDLIFGKTNDASNENEKVIINLSAVDEGDDISEFICKGLSEDGSEVFSQTITDINDGSAAHQKTVSLAIPTEFKGKISVTVNDKKGHSLSQTDTQRTVIADDSTGVAVSTSNVAVGSSTKPKQTVIIDVTEKNFYEDGLTFTGTYTPFHGTAIDINNISEDKKLADALIWSEQPGNIHRASYTFEKDGTYDFTVTYTDKSKNTATSQVQQFTIDCTMPIVELKLTDQTGKELTEQEIYSQKEVYADITITEAGEFDPSSGLGLICTAVDSKGNNITLSQQYEDIIKNSDNWTGNGAVYQLKTPLKFTTEANYTLKLSYTDAANNGPVSVDKSFTYDQTKPEITVTYKNKLGEQILSAITLGYYQPTVTVTITTEDTITGMDMLQWSTDNGESWSASEQIAEKTIKISEDSKNDFAVKAVDKCGVEAVNYENKTLVVDGTKPGIIVSSQQRKTTHDGMDYYQGSVTQEIKITEANFNAEHFVINANGETVQDMQLQILKKDESSTTEQWSDVTANFVPNGFARNSAWSASAQNSVEHTMSVTLDKPGIYKIYGTYTDLAGNQSEICNTTFTVDEKAPEIHVVYAEQGSVSNENQYNGGRTATIAITEHNFDVSKVNITLEAIDGQGKTILTDKLQNIKDTLTWYSEGDTHTTTISYTDDANYTFTVECTDKAGQTTREFTIGDSADKKLQDVFTVDTQVPSGSIAIEGWNKNATEAWKKEWKSTDTYTESFTFGLSSYKTVKVKVANSDSLSGIDTIRYFTSEETYSKEQLKSVTDKWTALNKEQPEFFVEPNQKFIVYVCITDKAGNQTYIASNGIIADSVDPEKSMLEVNADVSKPINGYYTGDVPVKVLITDKTPSSGIKSVSYTVTDNTIQDEQKSITQSGNLTVENGIMNPDQIITVDSSKNNSNSITVTVTAEDNAGNKASWKKDLSIDITAPEVTISYNDVAYDTQYADDELAYFKDTRTATISVKERNFSKENFTLEVTSVDGKKETHSEWKEIQGQEPNGDDTVHQMTVTFDKDDTYTIESVAFLDDAQQAATVNYADGTVYGDQFVIAKTAPEISVKYYTESGTELTNSNYYYHENIVMEVIVNSHYFDSARVDFTMTEKFPKDANGSQVSGIEEYAAELTKKDNWSTDTQNADIHTAKILFHIDAEYSFDIKAANRAGVESEAVHKNFVLDQVAPESLQIEYQPKTWLEKLIDNINHLFFNKDTDKVTVKLSAVDKTSGIEKIEYSTNGGVSYAVVDGKNDGFTAEKENGGYSFDISALYKGEIAFKVTDKSGLVSTVYRDNNTVVIDTEGPKIEVKYSSTSVAVNGNYYNAGRTAVITVTEANFYPDENVSMQIERRLNTENNYSDATEQYAKDYNKLSGWKSLGNYQYQKTIYYNEEADYTFSMSVSDYAGNVTSYEKEQFTVDKTNPVIAVSYDNDTARNGNQFNKERTATITVTEHNFRPSDVDITITAVDAVGNVVNQEYLNSVLNALKDNENSHWTNETGDIHKATIRYPGEANYTFDIKCTDLAGNQNYDENHQMKVDYGTSVAPTEFTVDTVNPLASIQIGEWTQSKNGAVWDHYLDNFTFSLWTGNTVSVAISNEDILSGVEYIEYYKTDSVLTENQLKTDQGILWVQGVNGKTTFDVAPDEQFIVYAHIVDRAGNETYISSDGVIVDRTQPNFNEFSPRVIVSPQQPVNDIYSTDVTMDVYATDPATGNNVYSGLRSITYSVRNMGEETQSGTLYNFGRKEATKDELLSSWSGTIAVDCNLNNSNDVEIVITATDNADNETVAISAVQIDVTAPKIEVSYDNNTGDSSVGDTTYFNQERIATIAITERNFNPDDIVMTINSTENVMPDISGWSTENAAGNRDETVHTATVRYYADGDYTFDIAYNDMAGNEAPEEDYGNSLAPTEFTVDMTNPIISVAYDTDDALNGNYFKQVRTATLTIEEHNFETSRVQVTLSADGTDVGAPSVSDWSTSGDIHTATVVYTGDAMYTFAMEYTDQAGNTAEPYAAESFYVDVTNPTVEIQNVENNKAYSGTVTPMIAYSDQYYDSVDITLTGANTGSYNIDDMGSYATNDNGGTFTFKDFTADDIYTLTAKTVDKAGNTSEDSVIFSVNRNGSTYDMDEDTKKLNGSYVASARDIVIYEVNPDELSEIKITLFKNDKTIVLTEGTDYSITLEGGNGQWYKYTYTIYAKNFADDGVYRIAIHSKDKAENIAENMIDTKNKEISFGIDSTAPNIMVMNVESDKTYSTDNLTAIMGVSDNLKLASVEVYLDGKLHQSWDAETIKGMVDSSEDFAFDISGESTEAHFIRVIAADAAGNPAELALQNVYVTTNLWIRYYTNKLLFYGSIGGISTVSAGGVASFVLKRRKINLLKLLSKKH